LEAVKNPEVRTFKMFALSINCSTSFITC